MDIGSLYTDYLTSTATKAGNLEKTLKGDTLRKSDNELLDVCKEFEAYFYEQVFKNMEKAMVPSDDSGDNANGTLVDYYKEQLIGEYSKSVVDQSAEGGNSLAMQLYEQMKRNQGIAAENIQTGNTQTEDIKIEDIQAEDGKIISSGI